MCKKHINPRFQYLIKTKEICRTFLLDMKMERASVGIWKAITESHFSSLRLQAKVKRLGQNPDPEELCCQLYPNPDASLKVCPRYSALSGLQFLSGCHPLQTSLTRDLMKDTQLIFKNQLPWVNKQVVQFSDWKTSLILPIILLRMSGGSWGLWESSPVKVFLRPCRECVANVSLSKRIMSRADVYFL